MPEVDVIAQFNHDGSIIPKRLRFPDEDGVLQTYSILGYRELSHDTGDVKGLFVTATDPVWECEIAVLGMKRKVLLTWNGRGWKLKV